MNSKNAPLVSVVMITYNHEKFIQQAIEGVLMQEYIGQIELIIANDQSPDDTDATINNIIKEHPRGSWIKYTNHTTNIGMKANFIWALEQANGKYVALCEGDDYWTDPLKLQKQVDFLESNNEYVMSYTKSYECFEPNNIWFETVYPEKIDNLTIPQLLKYSWFIRTATILYRRDKLDLCFLINVTYGADYFIQLLLLNQGKFHFLNEITSVYRHHPGGISLSSKNVYLERRILLINYLVLFDNYTKNLYSKEIKDTIQTIRIGIFDYSIMNLKFKYLSFIQFVDFIPLTLHVTKRVFYKIKRSLQIKLK